MLIDQQILRIPGPCPIPPSVLRAMSQPVIGHRLEEAQEMFVNIKPRLQQVFGTKQDVIVMGGSGTAGLETAVVNSINPGDEVLIAVTGVFGEVFNRICEAHDIKVNRLDFEWGTAAKPDAIKDFLEKNENIKAVFFTFCETSTGVLNPIGELAKVVHEHSDALVIVDGVSSVGGAESKMDEWGVDILVTGSQKAMMLPPGLAFIGVSERAWVAIENNQRSRYYFDLTKYRDQLAINTTPFTSAVSIIFALDQTLKLMHEEGLEQMFNRHKLMRDMSRAAFKKLNIPLFTTDDIASPTVTVVKPDDFKVPDLIKVLKEDFNLVLAGGLGHLRETTFRVGHMGYCSPADILQCISLIEIAMSRIGKNIQLGEGTYAAQEVFVHARQAMPLS